MDEALRLREEAGRWVTEARGILERAKGENRAMTAEEQNRFDKLHDDAEKNLATAERLERQKKADAGFAQTGSGDGAGAQSSGGSRQVEIPQQQNAGGAQEERQKKYDEEFRTFLRTGRMTPALAETRATLQMDNDIGGGFISASSTLVQKVLKSVTDKLVIRQYATIYPVAMNANLGAVSLEGDISEFTFAGELTSATEDTGIELGKRELKPKFFAKKLVKVSRALLESALLDVEGLVAERVAIALAKGEESAFMTGSGANAPLGLFTASSDGIPTSRDVATGNATGFTADGLMTIQGTLADEYDVNARWLFHKDAITAIRKLKDGNGQYLWQPGLALGTERQILGKPYITGGKVPSTFTNGLYAGMYGDFSYYWIADAVSMKVQRLLELYALTGQVGLLFGDMAVDGMPVMSEAFVRIKCSA